MPHARRLSAALAACLASACLSSATPIAIDLQPGEVLIVATTAGGSANNLVGVQHFVYYGGGNDDLAFSAPANQAFFTFRLKSSDFVRADGTPIAPADFARVRVRLQSATASTESDPSKVTGACGRCLVFARKAPPQIVNDGDSCAVPAFADGLLWAPANGGFEPRSDPTKARLIEDARAAIRLDWPHPCACAPKKDAKPLEGVEIRPITPELAPWPLQAFAERDSDHLIAAFGDGVAISFDVDRGAPAKTTVIPELGRRVDAALPLRSGDFLLATQRFNTLNTAGSNLDRFVVPTDGPDRGKVTGPFPIMTRLEHVSKMKYVRRSETAPYPRAPVYLFGLARIVTAFQPTMAACTDDMYQCSTVRLTDCTREAVETPIFDLAILDDGSGVAVTSNAVYYKPHRAPPADDPDPQDTWTCSQRQEAYEWVRNAPNGSRPMRVRPFRALGRAGNRLFLCGDQAVDQCSETRAVVLTATVGAAPDVLPNPDWRILMTAGDRVKCHHFLDVPGDPRKTRLLFNNGVTKDLDENGTVVQEGRIGTLFTPGSPPWVEIARLSSRSLLMRTRENGIYRSDGRTMFQRLYGSDRYEQADYQALVPIDTGFFAFGNPKGLVEVTVPKDTIGRQPGPVPTVQVIDWHGLRKSGDTIYAAVVDSQSSRAGAPALLVAGANESGGRRLPLLRRASLGRDGSGTRVILETQDVDLLAGVEGIGFVGLSEIAPGKFVILGEDVRIFQLDGNQLTELPIDFDAPDTPEVEMKPKHEPYVCGGGSPPVNWRAIDGGNGAAWAVGELGLIVRVAGGKVERYIAPILDAQMNPRPVNADWSAVRAICPDQVLVGGQYPEPDLYNLAGIWEVAHRGSVPACALGSQRDPTANLPDGLLLRQVNETCVGFPNVADIRFGVPVSLVRDGTSVAVGFDNGHIHRVQATRTERIKVPFNVEATAQNPNGHLLFGGNEARLAVGIPTSTRTQ